MSRKLLMAATAALAVALSGGAFAGPHEAHHGAAAQAIADPGRPAADVARDADRKPAEMLAFAEVKPGEVVAELLPGGGYFTRIFSKAVGPKGRIYAVVTEAQAKAEKPPAVNAIAADPAYANVKVVAAQFAALALPEKVDLIWTSQNYHDLHLAKYNDDVAAVNRAIYQALKPGGLYVVLDHAAAAGTGLDIPDKLHRIDPAIVRREVEAAGFRFEGESSVLRNPADDHTLQVFDPAIRGHTDQFVYKFRKPK
ncbi:methyltransferase domain-containing protein [Phenylobacterium sp. LjRoot225]|uniref:class I SAM-dependent methyltransferase n=1 Tax=Phenylobacterium sp. LjRoot225 TaxID=3342285 RepID=UPI003ED08449